MKLFMFFVNTLYWLQLFIAPVSVFSFAAFWVYGKDDANLPYALILVVAGLLLGVFIAEKVRKKFGLSNFFGRMAATSETENKQDAELED